MLDQHSPAPPTGHPLDPASPRSARVHNYWLGGKDHFAADRAAGDAVIAVIPTMPRMVRENRAFLGRAVRHLVTELGVRQFLEVGAGIPAEGNVHEVAQGIDPTARVVYVDNDPVVLTHSRALMTSTPTGRIAVVDGDALDPHAIMNAPEVSGVLDRAEPIAVMLISVLQYLADDQARDLVATMRDALAPGSFLSIGHPTGDFAPEIAERAAAVADAAGLGYRLRGREQIAGLLAGLDLVDPGVVPMLTWRPTTPVADPRDVFAYAAMGRTPR